MPKIRAEGQVEVLNVEYKLMSLLNELTWNLDFTS